MAQQKRIPELKVVFDTNALFTGSASDLVNSAISQLITAYASPSDVTLSWHLPAVVVHEREYQMRTQGFSLLPSVQKLERLLGHNLNITEDIIATRVKEAIQRQLTELNLTVIDLDADVVSWEGVINSAIFREPPFEKGEKEKGFRDALIAESFMQLVANSPSTPRYCRLAMLTRDELLAAHLMERTQSNKNVKIFTDIKELRGLINTLVSEVKEELIEKVQPKAQEYFFVPQDKSTYYYQENVRDMVANKFREQLEQKAPNSHSRENGTWYISKPEFISKSGQRIKWSTRIDVQSRCYKREQGAEETEPTGLGLTGLRPSAGLARASLLRGLLAGQGELVADGRTTFEVVWSILVSTNLKFRNPRIEDIRFVEIDWTDKLGE